MKILLTVLTVFTLPLVHAEEGAWFKVESRKCETGTVYRDVAEARTPVGERIQLAEDLKSAKVIDGEGVVIEYTLTLQGKNTYLATPVVVSENPQHFFIKKTDEGVSIYSSDWMQERCSGGLIVSSMITF